MKSTVNRGSTGCRGHTAVEFECCNSRDIKATRASAAHASTNIATAAVMSEWSEGQNLWAAGGGAAVVFSRSSLGRAAVG